MKNQLVLTLCSALLLAGLVQLPVNVSSQGMSGSRSAIFSEIDDYVEDQMEASRIPGVAIAIVEGDRIIHADGYGWVEERRRTTPQVPFPLGSLSKSFTALAVMQLVEAGKVELDTPVQHYVPWFQVADPDASTRITVRHLLNQTSGLSRVTGNESYLGPILDGRDTTLEQLVRGLAAAQLNRPVGATFEYSNANYIVLALVVQEVASLAYGDYVEQSILRPLGMDNSSATGDVPGNATTDLHRFVFGAPWPITGGYLPDQFPGGYLVASAEDMGRYLGMYLNNGSSPDTTVLSPAGIEQMLAPATNTMTRRLLSTDFTSQYGMGWFTGPFGAADNARWHLGELPYFTAWMILLPEQNLGVVVLINAGSEIGLADANEVMSRIPVGVTNLLLGEPAPQGKSLFGFYIGLDIALVVVGGVQLWALGRLSRRTFITAPRGQEPWLPRNRLVTPLVWEFGLGLTIPLGLPMLLDTSWGALFLALPDLTVALFGVSIVWLATGVVRLVHIRATRHVHRNMPVGELAAPQPV